MKAVQLEGKKFGKLLVIGRAENGPRWRSRWICQCDCGKTVVVLGDSLKSGKTNSCGCLSGRPGGICPNISGTVLYDRWQGMKRRCYEKKHPSYKYYGERGIKVCNEWLQNPVAFYNWSIENGFSEELTLDRIDVNGDYTPENCRWVTIKEQNKNKRNNRIVKYNGVDMLLCEYIEKTGVNPGSINWRLNSSKMSEEEALNRPYRKQSSGVKLDFNLSDECRKRGLNRGTVWARINKLGWDIDTALSTPAHPSRKNKN